MASFVARPASVTEFAKIATMNTPNPYAQNQIDAGMVVEERTSVLAIVALVLSLVCIIPGFGLLGAVLAVIALIMISGSNGRLGGRGLAIAALIIGLLVSAVWVGGAMLMVEGGKQFTKMFSGNTVLLLQAAESGDYTTARSKLDPSVASSVSDADFARFVSGYTGTLGKYKSAPSGLFDLISAYANVGPMMQGMQGQNQGMVPLPVQFDNGWGVVVLQLNQAGGGPNMAPLNVEVLAGAGTGWKLYDPAAAAPAVAPDATKQLPDESKPQVPTTPGTP